MQGSHVGARMRRAVLGSAALAALVFFAIAGTAFAHPKGPAPVEIVSQGTPPAEIPPGTTYFSTIQAAVNASTPGTFILVEPGIYREEVKVVEPHHDIYIRGMNRNTVILDGEGINTPGGANGIEIYKTNNVWVENLTVRNFNREGINGGGGNEIWWNGGSGSNKVQAKGWYGSYLTAYDTTLNGGYGIFTNNEEIGEWDHVYSSGFNDSGLYIGACQECKAHVTDATIVNNAVGYSGSNSGGELTIEDSVFAHNSDGIVPNSENPGDGPPPQNGKCHKHNNVPTRVVPEFPTTSIERCTIIRHNLITENSNLTVPANGSTIAAPYGAGVQLPGDYADAVEENTITNNPTNGIMAFEYPNPFPQQADTLFFQLAGNKLANNTFSGNGYAGGKYAGAIFMQGGIFAPPGKANAKSLNDCAIGNAYSAGEKSYPVGLEATWNCSNPTTPNPNNGLEAIYYLLENQAISEHERTPEPQPAPGPQETMPNPCEGVPVNPLCK